MPLMQSLKGAFMTAFFIKILALVAMTLDHAAKIIGQRGLITLLSGDITDSAWLRGTYYILTAMTVIGRIAFPLYAFLIVEGTKRTRSLPKYFFRLLVFGFISEPFFYAAFTAEPSISGFLRSLSGLRLTNVFFTLALGALMIYCFELIEGKLSRYRLWLELAVFGLSMLIAGFIDCDYFYFGILLIGGLYFAQDRKQQSIVTVIWSLLLYALYNGSFSCFITASLAVLPITLYNGERGRRMKWCFYIYYPAHLAILTLISASLSA